MNKINLLSAVGNLKNTIKKYSPEILTGIGITGMLTTTVTAVRVTPKASNILAEIKDKHSEDTESKEMAKEVVKNVFPLYLPSLLICGISIGCLVGASSINFRRNAALATAYALSESALKDYQKKVIDTIGEKKEKEIQGSIAQDKLNQNPISNNEIIITGKGDTLCYDTISGRYFKSDIEKLKKIENELNSRLLREDYISLNDFYYEVGLSSTNQGNDLGWRVDRGLIEFNFTAKIADDDTPCIVLNYSVAPQYDYDR